ncbi:hypothetical protein HF521_019343 [Silurus meridionalis]|uniref:VWC2L C-terminal domain-containing protein n=1 Tax=Silurus meridionalis TaxID=175797 RepID=A0A8T0BGD3_SILME|nr:hypothetical protein HF521_019343 [Silurus meridionalis]
MPMGHGGDGAADRGSEWALFCSACAASSASQWRGRRAHARRTARCTTWVSGTSWTRNTARSASAQPRSGVRAHRVHRAAPACIHVSRYPSDCCARCERIGCEYRGEVYDLGQKFQPSEVNSAPVTTMASPDCKDGPNCYVDESRTQIIPGGDSVWVDSCTKCRCHDGQDAGYWEGNRVATCTRLRNCTVSEGQN